MDGRPPVVFKTRFTEWPTLAYTLEYGLLPRVLVAKTRMSRRNLGSRIAFQMTAFESAVCGSSFPQCNWRREQYSFILIYCAPRCWWVGTFHSLSLGQSREYLCQRQVIQRSPKFTSAGRILIIDSRRVIQSTQTRFSCRQPFDSCKQLWLEWYWANWMIGVLFNYL